jgi:hypothetical protein
MSAQERGALRPIRLVFELSREENPRLFDELSQFRQGRKRVNRLRLLAYDGLLAQHGVFAMSSLQTLTRSRSRRSLTCSRPLR